jgi:hypothetical protein
VIRGNTDHTSSDPGDPQVDSWTGLMGTDAGAVNCAALPIISLDFRALLHSLALCPCPPQYRHKPCAIRRSRSVCVNPPCTVRWWAMGGLLGGPRAADVAEVAGAPDTVLRVLGAGVP